MTPKEKAIELRDKFYFNTSLTDLEELKKCALIVIDENLEYEKILVEQIKNHVEIFKEMKFKTQNLFWESVKQELVNL